MIGFLVPVKSKKFSSDWDLFSRLLKRSLKSINGQTDKDFQIIVACHEIPEERFEHSKVHYIKVDFEPPTLTNQDRETDRQRKETDKAKKILIAYEYANKNFDMDYYMVVDSDDCIHKGISQYVNSKLEDNISGWYFKKGYFYREGKKIAILNKHTFNLNCGTCIIVKKEYFKHLILETPFLYYFHETTKVRDKIELKPFPMAGAVYSMANGENHVMSQQLITTLINRPKFFTTRHLKSVLGKMMKYRFRYIGARFKSSYNFYHIS